MTDCLPPGAQAPEQFDKLMNYYESLQQPHKRGDQEAEVRRLLKPIGVDSHVSTHRLPQRQGQPIQSFKCPSCTRRFFHNIALIPRQQGVPLIPRSWVKFDPDLDYPEWGVEIKKTVYHGLQ